MPSTRNIEMYSENGEYVCLVGYSEKQIIFQHFIRRISRRKYISIICVSMVISIRYHFDYIKITFVVNFSVNLLSEHFLRKSPVI
jgi:hypothetical protein